MKSRRILFVGRQDPTGRGSGSLLRTLGVGCGLAGAGEVHYLQRHGRSWRSPGDVVRHPQIEPQLPFADWTQVAAFGVPHRLKPALRYPWALSATVAPRRARPLLAARYPRISARALHAAVPSLELYDLIWFHRLETVLAFWPLLASSSIPSVVDFDDLTSADRDESARSSGNTEGEPTNSVHAAIEARIDTLDRHAWMHWQGEALRRAATVVLSNPDEAAAIHALRVRTVPNGYAVPPRTGPRAASPRPVLTFVGGMHYFPNADAARFFVREVLPTVRADLGDGFELRIVGEAPPSIQDLGRQPNVTVTGYVDDVAAELAITDVMIVPLRYGSGTRVKILEAFANEIPVVSTTVGASGLDVRAGEHLLVADNPREFARACALLARDDTRRRAIASAAYDLVASRYDWSVIGREIARIVEETIAGSP